MRRDAGFVDGLLFVFCYDRSGASLANGGNPSLVGRNVLHIEDIDGRKPIARDFVVNLGLAPENAVIVRRNRDGARASHRGSGRGG